MCGETFRFSHISNKAEILEGYFDSSPIFSWSYGEKADEQHTLRMAVSACLNLRQTVLAPRL